MTATTTNPTACNRCGTSAMRQALLLDDQGLPICGSCQAQIDAQVGMRKRAKNTMLAPAIASTLAYFSFLIPFLNFVAPGALAALAILGAVNGIRMHSELGRTRDSGVSERLRGGLLVMSILTIIFASIPLLMQVLAWVGIALH